MKLNKVAIFLSLNLGTIILSTCFAQDKNIAEPVEHTNNSSLETASTLADQTKLHVTIYNHGLGLIKDERKVPLISGLQTLAFKDVSAQIRPETALLKAEGINLLEQNFEYDLLSPDTLLNKFIGKTIIVRESNLASEEVQEYEATVLSTNNGVMLKSDKEILAANANMQFIYNSIPENLRDKPTLTLTINVDQAKTEDKTTPQKPNLKTLALTYLTGGINWHADYVLNLNPDSSKEKQTLDLKAWVTLDNQSGTDYNNAQLQLVAGDLNVVNDKNIVYDVEAKAAMAPMSAASPVMKEESLGDYHLYALDRPTTIKNKQSKQVSLLEAEQVTYHHDYVIDAQNFNDEESDVEPEWHKLNTNIMISFDNKKSENLGLALPKGIMRIYQKDSAGNLQFMGEDNIDHTPENEKISLRIGTAFDITAKKKIVSSNTNGNIHYQTYQVEINNAKNEDVKVFVQDVFGGDWKITKESVASTKLNSQINRWELKVPAKKKAILEYNVETFIYH